VAERGSDASASAEPARGWGSLPRDRVAWPRSAPDGSRFKHRNHGTATGRERIVSQRGSDALASAEPMEVSPRYRVTWSLSHDSLPMGRGSAACMLEVQPCYRVTGSLSHDPLPAGRGSAACMLEVQPRYRVTWSLSHDPLPAGRGSAACMLEVQPRYRVTWSLGHDPLPMGRGSKRGWNRPSA